MSKLLINEPIIAFQPSLAKMVGVDGALVLQQIHYWISNPKIGRKHEGKKWVRNSIDDWCRDNFFFWNRSKVSRVLVKLEDDGFISSRSDLNTYGPDRTKWYTVNYDCLENYSQFSNLRNGEDDDSQFSNLRNGEGEAILKNETTINKDYNKTTLTIPSGSLPPPENPSQNGTHAKTKPEGVSAKKRAAKKPTPHNDICRTLTEQFVEITELPAPTNGAALNKLWLMPLKEMYSWYLKKKDNEPWRYDEEAIRQTVELIRETFHKMKTPESGKREGLTVAGPHSVVNVARDVYATRQRSSTGLGLEDIDALYYELNKKHLEVHND